MFWPFWGQESRFLDFFKVVWELFRKCLGIVFSLKRPTFFPLGSSEALKYVDKASPGLTHKPTLFARFTSVIWQFYGSKKSFSGIFESFFGVV